MSAPVRIRKSRSAPHWHVITIGGCNCRIDPSDTQCPRVLCVESLPLAVEIAVRHAAMHTCPSWVASGERCTASCADCGGAGWMTLGAALLAALGLRVETA